MENGGTQHRLPRLLSSGLLPCPRPVIVGCRRPLLFGLFGTAETEQGVQSPVVVGVPPTT
jgi:hypothetical protein